MDGSSASHPNYVRLRSSDGWEFILDYRCATVSGTIRSMLAGAGEGGGFAEAETWTADLQIRGIVLQKVVEYLHWNVRYSGSKEEPPEFGENKIPPEIALELLMSADFLEV